jgi:SPP1 gp7 family putative phage head morphogenesis protein
MLDRLAEADRSERVDAVHDDLYRDTAAVTQGSFSTSDVHAAATKVATRVEHHSRLEFKRIGISLDDEPGLAPLIKVWRRGLVERVQGLEKEQLDRLEKILEGGAGLRVESLKSKIDWLIDTSSMRQAEMLARNQVVMLNQQITESRMRAAGIEEYEWTCAGNEKVSDAHAELDGQRFRFDDPPTDADGNTGNPGLIRPNCQCQACPVIPALEDQENEAA